MRRAALVLLASCILALNACAAPATVPAPVVEKPPRLMLPEDPAERAEVLELCEEQGCVPVPTEVWLWMVRTLRARGAI